ncbi:MAG: valine--tRNA ligase [Patescibacteria group bacterium]|jgi:valyl-tRNA synthetase|nr:valine--tRNA ligase [Patescibacteria group bacterium]
MKELSKSYNPADYEDVIYEKWEKSGAFKPGDISEGDKTYSIVMPPPNVTGTLHLGHAAMLAIEDLMIRYRRMQGDKTLWVPGTDHAAIATQAKVEKILLEEGVNRHELGREKFLERINQFAQESHDTITNQVKKMGSSCDWSREAFTLDATRSKAVRAVFKLMYDDGLIVRGDRVVNWCTKCHSTLSDDEVEYKAQKAKFYTFKYDKNFPISISSTRPETKLGDTAVAVNPKDERYKKYIGQEFDVDFCGQKLKIKIIGDRHVDMEFGTGALGVTPAHSMVDWKMAEDNKLEIVKVIDEDGNIRDGFGEFSGMTVYKARKRIVEILNEKNLIEASDEIDNNLSICYRCDTPIEPIPSLQWFIDVNKPLDKFEGKSIKDVANQVVREGYLGDKDKKINIYPERFEKNYFNWMENLGDWCISRQILYGHQVPVWYRGELKDKSEKLKDREVYVGIEAPEGEGWVQDTDTLDTWFSSGLWTFSTLAQKPEDIKIEPSTSSGQGGKIVIDTDDFRNFHPTNVMETGYDILFFWVARMIIMTTYAIEDIPFHDIYLHGLILDEKGKKMSKSKDNTIDPLIMKEKYGADATRLALVIGSSPGNDIKINEEKIASFRNFTNKLWNVCRFAISNFEFRISNENLIFNDLNESDVWILNKFNILIKEVTEDLDKYNFSQAGEKLREFTWDDLADWYLEILKFEKNKEKENVINYIIQNLLKFWHPFIPFVTEAIWGEMFSNEKMLVLEKWPEKIDFKGNNDFDLVVEIVKVIRNARSINNVEPAKKIKAIIYAGGKTELIKSQEILIKSLRTGIDELEIKERGEDPSASSGELKDEIFTSVGDIKIYLIGAIDVEKEKERIEKEIANTEKQISIISGKLSNEAFVAKAPEELVKKEKEKLVELETELQAFKKQLDN